jgi:hypothetical protein
MRSSSEKAGQKSQTKGNQKDQRTALGGFVSLLDAGREKAQRAVDHAEHLVFLIIIIHPRQQAQRGREFEANNNTAACVGVVRTRLAGNRQVIIIRGGGG